MKVELGDELSEMALRFWVLWSFIIALVASFIWLVGYLIRKELKTCPYCAEQIKKAARVCRYCRRDIISVEIENKTPRDLFK